MAPLCGEPAEDEWLRLWVRRFASLRFDYSPVSGLFRLQSLWKDLPIPGQRALLERALALECDIDPLSLRSRLLRQRGALVMSQAVEQELLPLF